MTPDQFNTVNPVYTVRPYLYQQNIYFVRDKNNVRVGYLSQYASFARAFLTHTLKVGSGRYLSQCMRFPTMWYVRPAKPQISLRISAVWSEPLLVAWVFYDFWATEWTPFGVSKLKRRLQRLVRVYTCQSAILLEISCTGHACIPTW